MKAKLDRHAGLRRVTSLDSVQKGFVFPDLLEAEVAPDEEAGKFCCIDSHLLNRQCSQRYDAWWTDRDCLANMHKGSFGAPAVLAGSESGQSKPLLQCNKNSARARLLLVSLNTSLCSMFIDTVPQRWLNKKSCVCSMESTKESSRSAVSQDVWATVPACKLQQALDFSSCNSSSGRFLTVTT